MRTISRGVKKLPAVVALLPHLEEQALIDLGERENVRVVHARGGEFMHLVEHVAKIPLRVDARAIHTGHDFRDHLLPRAGVRLFPERLEMRDEVAIDERKESAHRALHKFLALRRVGRGPILPAVRRGERRAEVRAHGGGALRFVHLAFVEDAEEKNPRQLGDILHRARAITPPHDVADAPDGSVDGALIGKRFAVGDRGDSGGRFGHGGWCLNSSPIIRLQNLLASPACQTVLMGRSALDLRS